MLLEIVNNNPIRPQKAHLAHMGADLARMNILREYIYIYIYKGKVICFFHIVTFRSPQTMAPFTSLLLPLSSPQ
jgi:hypothetical protein